MTLKYEKVLTETDEEEHIELEIRQSKHNNNKFNENNDKDISTLLLKRSFLSFFFQSPAIVDSESENGGDELFGLKEDSTNTQRIVVLVKQAVPVILSFFLGILGSFINLIFAGHFVINGNSSVVFAGVSLANMFANVSCLSILIGMSSAVETIGSQHNGAGNYKEVGLCLQRSFIVLGTLCIPIIFLWCYTWDIFLLLGVERDVCIVIRNFIQIRAFTIPIDVIGESYEKYLMSIGVMNPSMIGNIVFNVMVLILDLFFIMYLKLDYEYLAWSWVISMYISVIAMFAISYNHPAVQRTLQPFSLEAFSPSKLLNFVTLGLPGTIMLCSEWWAYEILTMFASMIGTSQVAAQTIILQTASLAFMVPLGLGIASASLVGNAIGASKIALAKQLGSLAIYSITFLEIFVAITVWFGGNSFVDLFSSDPEVKRHANQAMPFLTGFVFIDGLQGVASGVLRGAGKQFIGAVANLIAFYGIGLPTAYYLCFKKGFKVAGLNMGIALGAAFQVLVLTTIIFGFPSYVFTNVIHGPSLTVSRENGYETVSTIEEPLTNGSMEEIRNPFVIIDAGENEESTEQNTKSLQMGVMQSAAT